ncbi:MAG TPA: hypothetical protein VNX25_06865, partial [Verrucomicrobiae bacterium]|nr:hypothetical protein [Verrucomicrobiae bacterium]
FGLTAAAFGPQLPAPAVADPALGGMTVAPGAGLGGSSTFTFAKAGTAPKTVVQAKAAGAPLTDPTQVVVVPVKDTVTGTAQFNTKTGVLLIKATSNFFAGIPASQRPALTATVNGQQFPLNAAGNGNIKLGAGAANPGTILVTSAAGGQGAITVTAK